MGIPTDRSPIIETPRLRLAPLEAEDAQALFPVQRDPASIGHWGWAQIEDPEEAARIIEGQATEGRSGRAFYWTIRRLEDEAVTGCCDLSGLDRKLRRAELGFLLGRAAKAEGHGVEALRPIVVHAAALGVRRLQAVAPLGNRLAESMLESLGFVEQGVLRGQVERDGERRDGRLYALRL